LFVVFYTTLFTNGTGFLTGLVGSLGYWLSQQGVQRGSQPWYYFALVQLPMYEYLPLVGSLLAWGLALKKGWFSQALPARPAEPAEDEVEDQNGGGPGAGESRERLPIAGLLLFWSLTSLVAFSIAGEKMPWLTYHIAVGLILGAAWAFGYLVESTPWRRLRIGNGWLGLVLAPVLVLSLAGVAGSLLGAQRPFAGNSLEQLQATTTFIFGLVTAVASGWGLGVVLRSWSGWELGRIFGLSLAAILVVLTARTAIRANYINYDTAKEFLVYAHAARGPKDILAQVEEISRRTTGGLDIAVAYDNDGLYPYWWYFRHYPNKNWYGEAPTRELRNNPVIIASEVNYDKMQNIVGDAYTSFEYFRLWWPMQEYFNLTWERIGNAIRNPQMREALARIWLNADYSLYAQVTGLTNLTETTWSPSNKFRMYIRKDIVAQMWNYGVAASAQPVQADPYEAGMLDLAADRVFGSPGAEPGQFNAPRALAVAPDGSLYVADSRNHRIQHLAPDGQVLQVWGSFADANAGEAPAGTFNEPWGVAVAPDGAVYVADTWNNRIQQFTPDGQFVRMWGYFGQAEAPEAFWGPRGVAVDGQGRVYVSDTGNKRVVVFDGEGGYLSQFGGKGFEPGQFDEPVGVAVAPDGRVYVADTWNQRVQVLLPVEEQGQPLSYVPQAQWDIVGWYGQSVENKPYLAASEAGQVFVADPEGSRVLEFGPEGEFVRGWGDFGTGPNGFGLAAGVGVDGAGGVWVADAGNHRIMHFTLP